MIQLVIPKYGNPDTDYEEQFYNRISILIHFRGQNEKEIRLKITKKIKCHYHFYQIDKYSSAE